MLRQIAAGARAGGSPLDGHERAVHGPVEALRAALPGERARCRSAVPRRPAARAPTPDAAPERVGRPVGRARRWSGRTANGVLRGLAAHQPAGQRRELLVDQDRRRAAEVGVAALVVLAVVLLGRREVEDELVGQAGHDHAARCPSPRLRRRPPPGSARRPPWCSRPGSETIIRLPDAHGEQRHRLRARSPGMPWTPSLWPCGPTDDRAARVPSKCSPVTSNSGPRSSSEPVRNGRPTSGFAATAPVLGLPGRRSRPASSACRARALRAAGARRARQAREHRAAPRPGRRSPTPAGPVRSRPADMSPSLELP